MPEPLTTPLVADVLEQLMVAFPRGRSGGTPQQLAEVYRNGLAGLTGDAVRFAARTAIQEDQFFPKVARIREIASRWQRSTETQSNLQIQRPTGWCEGCRTVAAPQKRWRPKRTPRGQRILDGAGRIALEEFERLVCKCDPPSRWYPDDPTTEYMTDSGRKSA